MAEALEMDPRFGLGSTANLMRSNSTRSTGSGKGKGTKTASIRSRSASVSSSRAGETPIGVNFNCSLSGVNDTTHHFEVDFDLLMHHVLPPELVKEDAPDRFVAIGEESEVRSQILVPEAYIWNVDDETNNGVNIYVNFRRGIILYQQNFIALWRQGLDLHRFPFDRHLLHMPVSFQNCHIKPWDLDLSTAHGVPFTFEATFQCYTSLGTWKLHNAEQRFEPVRRDLTLILLKIERRAEFYVQNITVFLFFIAFSSGSVVALPASSFSDRQSISLSLMLTAVAFKYIVTQQLPPVSYTTLMDKYVLLSFLIIVIVMAENVVLAFLSPAVYSVLDDDQANYVDRVFMCLLIGAWGLIHIIFFIVDKASLRQDWDEIERTQAKVIQRRQSEIRAWQNVTGAKNDMEILVR